MKVRIGTRDSVLAMAQARQVADGIREYDPQIEIELVPMKTTGDLILDKTLDKIGGKGLFVKELDRALQQNEVDIVVHSMKDMTMEIDENFPILATSVRENPSDVLVLPKREKSDDLDRNDRENRDCGISSNFVSKLFDDSLLDSTLPIGSSSARRNIQLQKLFPQMKIKPVRGNVLTRLEKLDRGEYSALVLAAAGLKRLRLSERISREFTTAEIIPANCQAVICVQGRADFPKEVLSKFHSEESYQTSMCERAFVRELDGGCSAPIAAFATVSGENITLKGLYVVQEEFEEYKNAMERGEKIPLAIYEGEKTGCVSNAEKIGRELAQELKNRARKQV